MLEAAELEARRLVSRCRSKVTHDNPCMGTGVAVCVTKGSSARRLGPWWFVWQFVWHVFGEQPVLA